MGISLGIALLLMSAFSVLVVCFCCHYQRTRQQRVHSTHLYIIIMMSVYKATEICCIIATGNSLPNQACNTNRKMVTNPIYDHGELYDSIDQRFYSTNDGSPVQATPRYSYSPNHNVSSLDTVPRITETMPMTYHTTVHTSSSGNTVNSQQQ